MVECPTCAKAMKQIVFRGHTAAMWCEGCGTLDDGLNKPVVPQLVERCRSMRYDACTTLDSKTLQVMRDNRITECIG